MRLPIHLPKARRARIVVGGVAAAGMIASAVGTTTAASAATSLNLVASTTTLSGQLSEDGSTLTLTASVSLGGKPGNLNLGNIVPGGSVSFSDDRGDNLGSAAIPSCLLKACVVVHAVPVSAISDGTTRVTASYPGDLVLKPSSASIAFGKSDCTGDAECDFVIQSGTTTLEVNSEDADTDEPAWVDGSLGGPTLPCSLGVAQVANFSGVNLDSQKGVTYTVTGAAADAYSSAGGDGAVYFCWVSPNAFYGYNPGSTSFAGDTSDFSDFSELQISGGTYNGEYVGLLPTCDDSNYLDSDTSGPCITDYEYNGDAHSMSISVLAPAGDPHAGG